jgi:hypothetical protein
LVDIQIESSARVDVERADDRVLAVRIDPGHREPGCVARLIFRRIPAVAEQKERHHRADREQGGQAEQRASRHTGRRLGLRPPLRLDRLWLHSRHALRAGVPVLHPPRHGSNQ